MLPRVSSPRYSGTPRYAPLLSTRLSLESPRSPYASTRRPWTTWLALFAFASSALLLWATQPGLPEIKAMDPSLAALQELQMEADVDPLQQPLAQAAAPPLQRIDVPPLNLQRSLAAVETELWIDLSDDVGACSGDVPLLPHLHREACWSLHCLWSDKYQANIDLWFSALTTLDPNVLDTQCVLPKGGQLQPPAARAPPDMSIILLAHTSAKAAAQTLLEAFRVARELRSAEFIVLNCLPPDASALLTHSAARLNDLFGTHVTFLDCASALPTGPDVHRALSAARSSHALLLSTSSLVTRGSLTTLLATLQTHSDAAAAAPMLVAGHHVVADGGGILFSDATSTSYARGARPSHNASFLRPADFVSTACVLVVRSALLRIAHQLDFAHPAAAAAGLAALLADINLRVLYQPLAVVHHALALLDPAAGGAPAGGAAVPGQVPVATLLSSQQLQGLCEPGTPPSVAARRVLSPKVVWITDSLDFGGVVYGLGRRLLLMQAMLAAGYDVTLQPVASLGVAQVQQARFMGVDVLPHQEPAALQLGAGGACRYDGVIVSSDVFASTQPRIAASCPVAPIICDLPDLQSLRKGRQLLSSRHVAEWDFASLASSAVSSWLVYASDPAARPIQAMQGLELDALDRSHTTVVADTAQQEALLRFRPDARVAVIGNMFPPPANAPSCDSRQGLLFTASADTSASQLAAHWLLVGLVPQILATLPAALRPEFVVHIVGRVTLSSRSIEVAEKLGRVFVHDSLEPAALKLLYGSVKIVAAPFATSSFRSDILQAMVFGVPVVGTPTVVEGLQMRNRVHCMVAGSFQEFVQHAVAVYSSCKLWNTLSGQASELLRGQHSVERLQREWLHVMQGAGVGPVPKNSRRACSDGVQQQKMHGLLV